MPVATQPTALGNTLDAHLRVVQVPNSGTYCKLPWYAIFGSMVSKHPMYVQQWVLLFLPHDRLFVWQS